MKQAPINSNQYEFDQDQEVNNHNNKPEEISRNPIMNEQPQNYNNGNRNAQTNFFGKFKSCYTNPDTPCQNYIMMFLTFLCVLIMIFMLYSLLGKE